MPIKQADQLRFHLIQMQCLDKAANQFDGLMGLSLTYPSAVLENKFNLVV